MIERKSRPTLVFDLDGTLVDTAPDLMRAANYALEKAGLRPISPQVLRPAMSHGARRMIENGLHAQGSAFDAALIDRLTQDLLVFYTHNIAVESRLYDGVADTLTALKAKGASLAVCTNKMERLSRLLLGALGIDTLFDCICGRDTFPVCKPHPDHLLNTISACGGTPERSILIGDSEIDIATAHAAGVPVIAVSYGYSDVPLASFAPSCVIDRFDALPAMTLLP